MVLLLLRNWSVRCLMGHVCFGIVLWYCLINVFLIVCRQDPTHFSPLCDIFFFFNANLVIFMQKILLKLTLKSGPNKNLYLKNYLCSNNPI